MSSYTAAPEGASAELPLSEQAYRQIRAAVLRGQLSPGSRLKMDDLQRVSGLSNSPLREALNRLAMEGLVVALENRGFRVAPISAADLQDITRLRILLEREALTESMQRGGDAWESDAVAAYHRLEKVEQRIANQKLALSDEWTERHRDFHLSLFDAASSPRIKAQVAILFDLAERYRRLSAAFRAEPRQKSAEHRRLLELTLARNTDAACAMLQAHVQKTADNVEVALAKVVSIVTPHAAG